MFDQDNLATPISIIISALVVSGALMYSSRGSTNVTTVKEADKTDFAVDQGALDEGDVLPKDGVELPVVWGNLGSSLVREGVIDMGKIRAIYEGRGGLSKEEEALLTGNSRDRLRVTKENAQFILNMFWALGLASKNQILDSGEMMSSGDAGNFASTGGWTVSRGNPMDHYSKHKFFDLTPSEQALVDRVSRNIYRPCCGNSTHFPDCNHGMAMLGLIELMASQGASEEEIYKAALAVNSFWFPDNYLTIATYMKHHGVKWQDVSPKEVLGAKYSSGQGYANIASEVTKPKSGGSGGGCSV